MNNQKLKNEFNELLEEDGLVLVMFNMAQDLVQTTEGPEAQALNIITGTAFALFHAIQNYKENYNGKSNDNSIRIKNCKNGSRLS